MATAKRKRRRLDEGLPPLTPTQRRLIDMLNDGKRHTPAELWQCIDDEQSIRRNLNVHIQLLRRQLNSVGRDVVYESSGLGNGYRLVHVDA